MKRKISLLMLPLLLTVLLVTVINYKPTYNTLEDALKTDLVNSKLMSVIHKEKKGDSTIVFSIDDQNDSLYTTVIKKNFKGYEKLYSGMKGDIDIVSKIFGLSYSYFPAIKGAPLPIYFGVVGNKNIESIRVKESNKKDGWKKAKIIKTEDKKIWLVDMKGFEGSKFDIVGLSKNGNEVSKITDDISPWYAEQKPMESPY